LEVPYPTQPGQVGGHEGVGIVQKLGPGAENGRVKLGDRVGIKVTLIEETSVKGRLKANSGLPMHAVPAMPAMKEKMVSAL
jgi:propanol-preferring alcohol dehydrogenase